MNTVDVEVSIQLRGRSKPTPEPPAAPIPRITRLMALAIKFQTMVDQGEVRDYADLARLGYVTRARLTQIMNLLLLAPEIQEEVLQLRGQRTEEGALSERHVRPVTKIATWSHQKRAWARLKASAASPTII